MVKPPWWLILDKRDNLKYLVVIADEDKETLSHVKTDKTWLNNKSLFDNYTLEDGTPIGRAVE